MSRYDNVPYEMYPDNCERCAGMMGGVRGNENRYPIEGGGYRVLCDYCSVEIDDGLDREIICNDCGHPLSTHEIMKVAQVEAIWAAGLDLAVCSDVSSHEWKSLGVLVHRGDDKPANPCDVDYMTEISS